jgi:hypothetical protein
MSVYRDGLASVNREVVKFAVENIKTEVFTLDPLAARE